MVLLNLIIMLISQGEIQMARAKIQRAFLAVVMESPLYFSAPLQRRLEIPNFLSQRSLHYRICTYNQHLIRGKGNLKLREFDKATNK